MDSSTSLPNDDAAAGGSPTGRPSRRTSTGAAWAGGPPAARPSGTTSRPRENRWRHVPRPGQQGGHGWIAGDTALPAARPGTAGPGRIARSTSPPEGRGGRGRIAGSTCLPGDEARHNSGGRIPPPRGLLRRRSCGDAHPPPATVSHRRPHQPPRPPRLTDCCGDDLGATPRSPPRDGAGVHSPGGGTRREPEKRCGGAPAQLAGQVRARARLRRAASPEAIPGVSRRAREVLVPHDEEVHHPSRPTHDLGGWSDGIAGSANAIDGVRALVRAARHVSTTPPPPPAPAPCRSSGKQGRRGRGSMMAWSGRVEVEVGHTPLPPTAGVARLPVVFAGVEGDLVPRRRRGGEVPGGARTAEPAAGGGGAPPSHQRRG